jgi:integrase/recombinase XerD
VTGRAPRAELGRDGEEYLSWLAVEQGRSRNTLAAYRRDLVDYETFLAGRGLDLEHADPAVLDAFVASRRAQGLSAASVSRRLTAVRGLHRFRLDEGASARDPTVDVRPPRAPLRLPKAIDEEEVARLIDAAPPVDPVGRRDRAMLELLYGTGMRVSELVGLSLADLRSDTGLVRVVGKGDKERLVPLGRCADDALDGWLGEGGRPALEPRRWARRGDAEAVFLNTRGGRLTRQGAWGVLKGRARRAGLEDRVHPHVLRHSCASHMLAHGADIRVVQELLGHRSIATTQIYTRVTPEHLRRAYEQAHPRAVSQVEQ